MFDLDLSALSLPGLTRQSIILRRLFFFATDARVRLAHGRSGTGAAGMTRRYPYLVYDTVDESAGEIIILAVRHPARKRDHEDV